VLASEQRNHDSSTLKLYAIYTMKQCVRADPTPNAVNTVAVRQIAQWFMKRCVSNLPEIFEVSAQMRTCPTCMSYHQCLAQRSKALCAVESQVSAGVAHHSLVPSWPHQSTALLRGHSG
jgi:hypothetical protein